MTALNQLLLNNNQYMFFLSVRVHLYLNISALNADAPDLKSTLGIAFNCFGIAHYYNKLVGLNLDRARVRMGKHNGLNVLVQDEAPWLEVVHCFNYQLELAIKDTFIESPFHSNINEVLSDLYWLYQKSPKRLTQLKELSEAFEKMIPNLQRLMVKDGLILNFKHGESFRNLLSLHDSFRAACPY